MADDIKICASWDGDPQERIITLNLSPGLSDPGGITSGPDGSMLVADAGNHRIVAVWETGLAKVFCGGDGTGPGEFRSPVNLCAVARGGDSGFWIVDQLNQRLQQFDVSGQYIRQIAKCGPGKGPLLLPWHAAQFLDGLLAISQFQVVQSVQLISPEGSEEDCIFLDYTPGGLLVVDNILLVAEWNGGSVRVYERLH